MKTIVIYHDHCIDGFTAAWVAWMKFGQDATYVSAMHGDPPPDATGADVYILDFSYPRDALAEMARIAKSVLVLDHHKTAQEALLGLPYAVFDMNRSGAGLAWDNFFPRKTRPWLVDYVEDRDLWRFRLQDSKAVNAFVGATRQTFGEWMDLSQCQLETVADSGTGILRYIDRYVEEMSAHARNVDFEGYRVPIVNASPISISELVGHLAETAPFAVGWFQRRDGKYQYSLRSRGEVDVSEIAKKYGGGGHKGAAGFTVLGSLTPKEDPK